MPTVSHPDVVALPTSDMLPDIDQAHAHFLALNQSGEVREVRVLGHVPAHGYGQAATLSGYFDNAGALAEALQEIGADRADGIYITQNPVDPDLQARANNRFARKPKHTTSDADIAHLAYLTIDCDPVRKSGISSTDDELAAALAVRNTINQFVTTELGWPDPVVTMMSGNGGQSTYRIDLPADELGKALVNAVLHAADTMFSTSKVSVDTTLGNPSRLVKLSGTMARKGDALPHRPHRQATSTFEPEAGTVCEAQLRALADLAPAPCPQVPPSNGRIPSAGTDRDAVDVATLLETAGIGYRMHEKSWGRVYELDCCLSSDDHNDGAAILQFASGAVAYKCFHNRCTGKTWHDVEPRLGLADYGGTNGRTTGTGKPSGAPSGGFGSASPAQIAPGRAWPERRLLPTPVPPTPTLPAILVPRPLRGWVCDIADRVKLPLEMVAAPAIVAAASVVGRAVSLCPNRLDDFTVVASLWGAVIAPPGWMKSAAIGEAFRPLRGLAAAAHDDYLQAEVAHAVARERIEVEIKAIQRQMTEATKKELDLGPLEAALLGKRAELGAAATTERRYLTQDPTVEKLGELLRDNPRGMLLMRDELSGWMLGLDRPGREGDREFYLEAWNGTGSFTSDRISRGTIHIPAVTLSLFGGIQPGKLRPLVASALRGGVGDDGLLQRFQMTVCPDRLPPWSQPTNWPDSAARARAMEIFETLAALDGASVGASLDEIPYLRYSRAAQGLADSWRDDLEHRLRSGELDDVPAFAAHLAKYRSLVPALALTFYLIDEAARTPDIAHGSVGEEHFRRAADWCGFLEAHARKLYSDELHAGVSAAHALAAKIEAGEIVDGQSVRELYRHQWSELRTPERVDAGLTELSDLGWVRVESVHSGGRPTHLVRLHPDLVARGTALADGRHSADRPGGADDA